MPGPKDAARTMRVFHHLDDLPADVAGAVIAIGNFDGVHRGHQAVIGAAREIATASSAPLGVLTFEPHPRSVFSPDAPPFRLSTRPTRAHHLEALGVDCLFELHFDMDFAAISAQAFVADILVGGLAARPVGVGENFVFGHRRQGDVGMLKSLAADHGFGVDCVAPVRDGADMVSSGRIRDLVRTGDVKSAAQALGRFWEIEARIEHGDGRGRDLGFATANLRLAEHLNPVFGIYVVRAGIDQGQETVWHDGVASFGRRPTFGGTEPLFEVHLFDFDEDIYGRNLRVRLVDYLRGEEKFDGVEALVAQMEKDAAAARRILAKVDAGAAIENSAAASS